MIQTIYGFFANRREVMEPFPSRDRTSDLKNLDFDADVQPIQPSSLGLNWNLQTDCFLFSISDEVKSYTRWGVLSTINSLCDSLGFVAPVTIQGRAILSEPTTKHSDWDATLSQGIEEAWMSCVTHGQLLCQSCPIIPYQRILCLFCLNEIHRCRDIFKGHRFCWEESYWVCNGKSQAGSQPWIHNVEVRTLCRTVKWMDIISAELDLQLDAITYYSDSKVVLNYICNETRCFYVYVSN